MKKIFQIEVENKNSDRLVEAIKNEIRKYLKRERKKPLPVEATYWDFDCRFGLNAEKAETVLVSGIISALNKAHEAKWAQCYVEIIAKPSFKAKATEESKEVE